MSRYGSAATGALGGAATGATIGSVVPVIGTGIGAAVGGVIGGVSSWFGSKDKKKKGSGSNGGIDITQLNNMSPEQMQLLQQRIGELGPDSYLAKLARGDESAFAESEEPAQRQFQELMGKNASRFSQVNGRKSSGFHNSNAQATQDFVSQLRSQRLDLSRQAVKDLHGMSRDLLSQRPYQYAQGGGGQGPQGSYFEQVGQGLSNEFAGEIGRYGAGKLQEQFKNWFSPATPNANPEA